MKNRFNSIYLILIAIGLMGYSNKQLNAQTNPDLSHFMTGTTAYSKAIEKQYNTDKYQQFSL